MPSGLAEATGVYLASDYSVPSDGRTPSAGALNRLLALVAANGGGTVQLVSGGAYLIDQTVLVPASTNGIELIIPTGTLVQARANLNADMFSGTGLSNFQMSGGGIIDGNAANQSAGNGVTLVNCVEPLLTDVLVRNCWADGASLSGCARPIFNMFSTGNGRHGVYMTGGTTFPTGVIVARDNGARVAGSGVVFDGASTDANLQVVALDTRAGGARTQQWGVQELAASGCDRNVILGSLTGNIQGAASFIGAGSKRVETAAVVGGGAPVVQAFGDVAAAGATGSAADAGHRHGMPGNGSVTTAQLAANAATQSANVVGSSAGPTTTSTTYVDLPEMTLTLTTAPRPGGTSELLVWFAGSFVPSTTGVATFALTLDAATEVSMADLTNSTAGVRASVATLARFAGVAAGSHTVKGRWQVNAGTLSAVGAQRYLLVEELKP